MSYIRENHPSIDVSRSLRDFDDEDDPQLCRRRFHASSPQLLQRKLSTTTTANSDKIECGKGITKLMIPTTPKSSPTLASYPFLSESSRHLTYFDGSDKIDFPLFDGNESITVEDCKPSVTREYTRNVSCRSLGRVSSNRSLKGRGTKGGTLQQASSQEKWIEISQGISLRLRGAQETWSYIEKDLYLPTTCECCSLHLLCITDASYVFCPACQVVSPFYNSTNKSGCGDGGVGLGFTFDQLSQWQGEIAERSK